MAVEWYEKFGSHLEQSSEVALYTKHLEILLLVLAVQAEDPFET